MVICKEFSKEPEIIFEEKEFAILYKPRALPTAPIHENEKETLLNWYLANTNLFEQVCGKKEIESGLLHRLDTATCGLVLIAKTQNIYNKFAIMQKNNLIKKTYIAFCEVDSSKYKPEILSCDRLPYTITSRFRAYGPKGKKVLPLFDGMRGFNDAKKTYTTTIIDYKKHCKDNLIFVITCTLTQGYRHQVRAHLASIGLPIYGDALYNNRWQNINQFEIDKHSYPLQLYAIGISFPKFNNFYLNNPNEYISFLLQPPNKMSL